MKVVHEEPGHRPEAMRIRWLDVLTLLCDRCMRMRRAGFAKSLVQMIRRPYFFMILLVQQAGAVVRHQMIRVTSQHRMRGRLIALFRSLLHGEVIRRIDESVNEATNRCDSDATHGFVRSPQSRETQEKGPRLEEK